MSGQEKSDEERVRVRFAVELQLHLYRHRQVPRAAVSCLILTIIPLLALSRSVG